MSGARSDAANLPVAVASAPAEHATGHPPDEILVGFAAAIRSAGVAVTTDRAREFLRASAIGGAGDRAAVYWAGRATLCGSRDDLELYDAAFLSWFGDEQASPAQSDESASSSTPQAPLDEVDDQREGDDAGPEVRAAASSLEVLRRRDIAALDQAERAAVHHFFATLRPAHPTRRSARRKPARRGEVDLRRTLREELRHGGEPARVRHRRRSARARRVVLLVDVSGSMAPYADSLLRLAHRLTAADPSATEVFTVGTRLTRITRAMRLRDGEAALVAAGQAVPDWSGGTRLGESFKAFLDRWGQRGMARGAVVVVLSDGWERGDADLLGQQMRRLRLLAHRVIWVNPHQGKTGYEPVQAGIVAALPYVDDLVAGHSIATFERALAVVARA